MKSRRPWDLCRLFSKCSRPATPTQPRPLTSHKLSFSIGMRKGPAISNFKKITNMMSLMSMMSMTTKSIQGLQGQKSR